MKLLILLFTSFLGYAMDSKEEKIRTDLAFDQGFYEPVEETIKGHPDSCPTGILALRKYEGRFQLWIGDRFYLSNINEGETRLDYEGIEDCYDLQSVTTSKEKITKLLTRFCKINKKDKDYSKNFEFKTEISFSKRYIDYLHEAINFDAKGKTTKSITKCTSKKYIKD